MQSEVTTQQTEKNVVDGIYNTAQLVILSREYYTVKKGSNNFVDLEANSENKQARFYVCIQNGPALKALIEDLTALYQESEN